MSYLVTTKAIVADATTNLLAHWASDDGKGVQWDNTPVLDASSEGPQPPPDKDSDQFDHWVRAEVRFHTSQQMSLGGDTNRIRHWGTVHASIFSAVDTGAATGLEEGDRVVDYYSGKDLPGAGVVAWIRFRIPDLKILGRTPDGKWFHVAVSCPFYFDVFK